MKTLQAYRFALDANAAQAANLHRHAGAARFAYNWGLARVKAAFAQRDAEQSYGLDGPRHRGHRHGRSSPPTRLQNGLVQVDADRRGPVVSKLEDLFRLWLAKPKPHPGRPYVHLPVLQAGG